MDSDDVSEKTRCEKQLAAFEKDSKLEMVGSFEAEFIGEKDNIVSVHRVPETHNEITKFMRRRCAILHPTVMYKKSAVIRTGNYHSVPLYEDYDLLLEWCWNTMCVVIIFKRTCIILEQVRISLKDAVD